MTKRKSPGWAQDAMQWGRWYWDRWLNDPGLRMCSYAAKGIWADILAHMARSIEPGVLVVGKRAMTVKELAKLLGSDLRQVQRLLAELTEKNVLSIDARGAIFNRRMRRDAVSRRRDADNGRQGGNPLLLGNKGLQQKRVNPRVKADSDSDSEKKVRVRNPSDSVTAAAAAAANDGGTDDLDATAGRRHAATAGRQHAATAGRQPSTGNVHRLPEPGERPQRRSLTSGMRRGQDARRVGGCDLLHETELAALAAYDRLAAVSNFCPRQFDLDDQQLRKLRWCLRVKGIAGFQAALSAAEASPLWQGTVGRGWKPRFDDVISAAKFRKLLEGGYPPEERKPECVAAVAQTRGKLGHITARMAALNGHGHGPTLNGTGGDLDATAGRRP